MHLTKHTLLFVLRPTLEKKSKQKPGAAKNHELYPVNTIEPDNPGLVLLMMMMTTWMEQHIWDYPAFPTFAWNRIAPVLAISVCPALPTQKEHRNPHPQEPRPPLSKVNEKSQRQTDLELSSCLGTDHPIVMLEHLGIYGKKLNQHKTHTHTHSSHTLPTLWSPIPSKHLHSGLLFWETVSGCWECVQVGDSGNEHLSPSSFNFYPV